MTITSSAFRHEEIIPSSYTCDGDNVNPPLTFSDIPKDAAGLALIIDDPDAPAGLFTHWMLYDMSPATLQILENSIPKTGLQGKNDFGNQNYDGPCPPDGKHRYYVTLFALKSPTKLEKGATRQQLDNALEGNVLEKAVFMGYYEKPNNTSLPDGNNLDNYTDDRNTTDGQVIGA
ncbi:MAG: YbhB/YbcL family Raf kinase inhibitor-like protein [Candidatus Saccharibacteria bacterium]|nr:YbhB/YbcL family Raf kinase inhibitor-like protein [Candidatus Saccharibacteria bacterium]